MILIAVMAAALLASPSAAAGGGEAADEELPSPADSSSVDPFFEYLESLERETDRSFSETSLERIPISGAEIDSLVGVFEETGELPDITVVRERRWRLSPGIAAARYNRVEGLNLMPSLTMRPPTRQWIETFGALGYGTASEEITWRAGLRARLMRAAGAPALEAGYARDLRRYGSGGIAGNSITALLFGGDYDDYFLGEGWEVGLRMGPRPYQIHLGYRIEAQDSLTNAAPFSFVGGEDAFRPNPAIDSGEVRQIILGLRTDDLPAGLSSGSVEASVAGNGLGGDFDYEAWRAEAVGARKLWFGDLLVMRAIGGLVTGDPPFQALHHLGGFQTLRGYEINEIRARQFAHLSVDYEIGTNLLRSVPLLGRLKIQMVPFFDGAVIFEKQARDGVVVELDEPLGRFAAGLGLMKNVLGIPGREGLLRLDIARRLDRREDAFTYRARITVEH